MAKLTEKQLYQTWLDIYSADQLNDMFLHDFEIEIREFKKNRNKTKRLLKKAADHYEKIYRYKPKIK